MRYTCLPFQYALILGLVLGTAGIIKVWDVLSGKLQTNIHVGSVILKMIWISLSKAQSALAIGLEDGSIFLYLYWSPSHLSKLRNLALGLLPFIVSFFNYHGQLLTYARSHSRKVSLQLLLLVQ